MTKNSGHLRLCLSNSKLKALNGWLQLFSGLGKIMKLLSVLRKSRNKPDLGVKPRGGRSCEYAIKNIFDA